MTPFIANKENNIKEARGVGGIRGLKLKKQILCLLIKTEDDKSVSWATRK